MRWRSLLWTASALVVASSDPFLATLNCERINPSFCCTSRIRDFCREKCADIECGPGFFNSRSKTDERQQATAREGDTSASSAMRVGVPSLTANAHQSSALINTGESVTPPTAQPNGQFPTLIPFQPEVVTSVTEGPIPPPTQPSPVLRTTTAASFVAPAAQEAAQPDNMTPPLMPPIPSSLTNVEVNNSGPQRTVSRVPRIRTTPDPRIIRPPESLAFISDFDEESGNDIEAVVIPANNMIPFENRQPEPPLGSEGPLPPLPEENGRHRHRSNENIPTPTSDVECSSGGSATVPDCKSKGIAAKSAASRITPPTPSPWQRAKWHDDIQKIEESGHDIPEEAFSTTGQAINEIEQWNNPVYSTGDRVETRLDKPWHGSNSAEPARVHASKRLRIHTTPVKIGMQPLRRVIIRRNLPRNRVQLLPPLPLEDSDLL